MKFLELGIRGLIGLAALAAGLFVAQVYIFQGEALWTAPSADGRFLIQWVLAASLLLAPWTVLAAAIRPALWRWPVIVLVVWIIARLIVDPDSILSGIARFWPI